MGIRCCDREQGFGDGSIQRFPSACLRFPQVRLELRPAALNRRQIRRIGGQIEEPGAALFDRPADAHGFVRPQVVHDHDVARMQRGAEDLLHIGAENRGIGRALNRHHRLDAVAPERRQHGHMRPIVLGHRPDHPLAPGGAAIQAGQREVDPGFIDELQALRIARGDLLLVAGPRLLDALGVLRAGVERLFLRGNPRRGRMRHIVGTLTRTPVAVATSVHSSARVASGWSSTSRSMLAWPRIQTGLLTARMGLWGNIASGPGLAQQQ